jgi:hypothetical protein
MGIIQDCNRESNVGAAGRRSIGPGGVPTMDVNDNACFLNKRAALESIASKLAPTRVLMA